MNDKLGEWNVDIRRIAIPEKITAAMDKLEDDSDNKLNGVKYKFITYLGHQIANGVNHAVLALQTISGEEEEYKNIVILKFNEKDGICTLYNMNILLEEGYKFGGYIINPIVYDNYGNIPDGSMNAFYSVVSGWIGVAVEPIALLATKIVNGINNIFLVTTTQIYPGAKPNLKMLTINVSGGSKTIDFEDIIL